MRVQSAILQLHKFQPGQTAQSPSIVSDFDQSAAPIILFSGDPAQLVPSDQRDGPEGETVTFAQGEITRRCVSYQIVIICVRLAQL